jgi:hypothetical protein
MVRVLFHSLRQILIVLPIVAAPCAKEKMVRPSAILRAVRDRLLGFEPWEQVRRPCQQILRHTRRMGSIELRRIKGDDA